MTGRERSVKLKQAQCLVVEVQADLDNHGAPCPTCSGQRYHNWPEHTLYMKLEGIIEKLNSLAANPADPT
jgi:hypothetical protein